MLSKKICLLGTFGVGKTSLVRRFVHDAFDENYHSTIGVQISQRAVEMPSGPSFNFILWDLAHIEKFDSVLKRYLQGSHGAVLVYDRCRPETLEALAPMRDYFHKITGGAPCVAAGNKSDLMDSTSASVICDYPCILTSARTGHGVDDLFHALGSRL